MSFGITIAIQAIVDGITAYINAAQKAAEKTKEANDAFKQTEDDIESYRTKIINLTKEINDSNEGYDLYSVNIKKNKYKKIKEENLQGSVINHYAHQTSDGSGKDNCAERYVFESE